MVLFSEPVEYPKSCMPNIQTHQNLLISAYKFLFDIFFPRKQCAMTDHPLLFLFGEWVGHLRVSNEREV